MDVQEFVTRLRDDLGRFRVDFERTRARYPRLFVDEKLEHLEWMRMFVLWLEAKRIANE